MQSAAERRKEQDEVAKKKKQEEAEKEKAKSGGRGGAGAGFAGQRAKDTEKLGEFEKHTKAKGVLETSPRPTLNRRTEPARVYEQLT